MGLRVGGVAATDALGAALSTGATEAVDDDDAEALDAGALVVGAAVTGTTTMIPDAVEGGSCDAATFGRSFVAAKTASATTGTSARSTMVRADVDGGGFARPTVGAERGDGTGAGSGAGGCATGIACGLGMPAGVAGIGAVTRKTGSRFSSTTVGDSRLTSGMSAVAGAFGVSGARS